MERAELRQQADRELLNVGVSIAQCLGTGGPQLVVLTRTPDAHVLRAAVSC
jgi:hypothetical protein